MRCATCGAALDADGIGGERLEGAGVRLTQRSAGWASMGPLDALAKIPKLLAVASRTALALRAHPRDLIVLVDFGAFNLRLARMIRDARFADADTVLLSARRRGSTMPTARERWRRSSDPLTAFAHQRDFYQSLGLPIGYAGHPLASTIAPRPPRPPAPSDGGVVALLPGSRAR